MPACATRPFRPSEDMSATSFTLPGQPASSPPALVIEPVLPHLLVVLSALTSLGFDVTVADTFSDGKASMTKGPRPSLLVAAVKLREYNGLHLVLRGKSIWPDLPAIVTSESADPVLQTEAERVGATFMVMPTSREEAVAAIVRTVLRRCDVNPGEPIRAPFERRRSERRLGAVSGPDAIQTDRRVRERRRNAADIRGLFSRA